MRHLLKLESVIEAWYYRNGKETYGSGNQI